VRPKQDARAQQQSNNQMTRATSIESMEILAPVYLTI